MAGRGPGAGPSGPLSPPTSRRPSTETTERSARAHTGVNARTISGGGVGVPGVVEAVGGAGMAAAARHANAAPPWKAARTARRSDWIMTIRR